MRAICLFLCAAAAAAGETAVFDRYGRLSYMLYGGDELAVHTNLIAASRGLSQSERTQVLREKNSTTWKGAFEGARFEQTATEKSGKTEIAVRLTAEAELDGVFFAIDVPHSEFAGGNVAFGDEVLKLPAHKPTLNKFFSGTVSDLILADASGNLKLAALLDRARPISIEDKWDRRGHIYSVMIALNHTDSMTLTLSLSGKPDASPAHLSLDAGKRRFEFQGFGGNYCFNIESPVTEYTLKNLRVGWARTEMSLSKWAPENDTAGSRLHNEFLLARQIQEKGIPYVTSIWQLPEQLYTDPGPKPQRRDKRRIAPDKWDALLESVGSYLLYAKRQYGVEPDLFSFNEANIGVDVLLSAEEHRDAIKRMGAHFEKLGLKTKMLLADATGPKGTHEYALAAANDPEAMRYVGAVGFHSWGGGTPEQYKAWGDLAEWLGLPLLVTELGVDAGAWRGRTYDSFQYGIREVQMYQELLLYARPQGTMQWEFTADYGTVSEALVPTHRFWFVKHFTDLTPKNSDALGTSSDHPKVLFTAFAGERNAYTLHVANLGAAREITIQGVPEEAREFRAIETSETEEFRALGSVKVEGGAVRLRMPQRSLLTLTTLPAESTSPPPSRRGGSAPW